MSVFDYVDENIKLDEEGWKAISEKGESFFKGFPFFKDPDFQKLTPLRQRFILAYTLKDLNGFTLYNCYKFAKNDFSARTLTSSIAASNLKRRPIMKKFLDQIDWMRVEDMGFSAQRILEEEAALAYSDVTEFLDEDGLVPLQNLKDLPKQIRRAIKSVEVTQLQDGSTRYKINVWDKGASLGRLEKIKGMQIDKVEYEGKSVNIKTETDPKEAARLYAQLIKGQ